MTSRKGKARERQLARDKYERQLSRRAASARRRRQVKAGVGILAVLLAGLTVAYFLGAFDSMIKGDDKPKDEPSASSSEKPSDEKSGKDEEKDKEDDKSSDESSVEPSSSGDGK